jgi:hypothetical protein
MCAVRRLFTTPPVRAVAVDGSDLQWIAYSIGETVYLRTFDAEPRDSVCLPEATDALGLHVLNGKYCCWSLDGSLYLRAKLPPKDRRGRLLPKFVGQRTVCRNVTGGILLPTGIGRMVECAFAHENKLRLSGATFTLPAPADKLVLSPGGEFLFVAGPGFIYRFRVVKGGIKPDREEIVPFLSRVDDLAVDGEKIAV